MLAPSLWYSVERRSVYAGAAGRATRGRGQSSAALQLSGFETGEPAVNGHRLPFVAGEYARTAYGVAWAS